MRQSMFWLRQALVIVFPDPENSIERDEHEPTAQKNKSDENYTKLSLNQLWICVNLAFSNWFWCIFKIGIKMADKMASNSYTQYSMLNAIWFALNCFTIDILLRLLLQM